MDELHTFLIKLNFLNNNIQFTLETMNIEKNLNFLDLTINILQNRPTFSDFRKLTYIDNLIDNNSFHPTIHKIAAFKTCHRLLKVSMSKVDYEQKLQMIKVKASVKAEITTLIPH